MIQLKIKNDELEKIEPRTLCEEAWQEIASHFPDFKVLSKGQKLKRVAKDKDIFFEIYFQANRYNNKDSVEFIPHIGIYSKESLLYYIYYFGGKNKAQQYFNRILKVNKFKNKYISFYESLKSMPEENIDLNYSEFSGANMIKFAYLNGIEIE